MDPGKASLETKATERGAITVSRLAQEYLDKRAEPRKRSAYQDERS